MRYNFGHTAAVNCVAVLSRISFMAQYDKQFNTVAKQNTAVYTAADIIEQNAERLTAAATAYIPLMRNPCFMVFILFFILYALHFVFFVLCVA